MRKRVTLFIIITVLCTLFTFGIYYLNLALQPQTITLHQSVATCYPSDWNIDNKYSLSGEVYNYPGLLLTPEQLGDYSDIAVLIGCEEALTDASCLVNQKYQSTIAFHLTLPADHTYAFTLPGSYPRYRIYVNGNEVLSSPDYWNLESDFPISQVLTLPYNLHGNYNIVMNLVTDPSLGIRSNYGILLGTASRCASSYTNSVNVSMLLSAFIFFTGIFYIIQYATMRKDKVLMAFILLCFAALMRSLILDDMILTQIVPHLSIRFISTFRYLVSHITLITLLYYTYRVFPDHFPTKLGLGIVIVQIILILDNLLLKLSFIPREVNHYMFLVIIALCSITAFKAMVHNLPYWSGFVISLELLLMNSIVTRATASCAIPAKYTHAYGFIGFAVMQITMLAKKYAAADHEEEYYKVEMTKTLETMQSSENAFLNAQMKPHFLYNTLNTIADLCVTSPPKAKKLISSLSDYLKQILNIDNTEGIVPLKRELELVTAYTTIEKERFPSINFFNDYPIRMPKVTIPPLTLQPLIENAIKHGLRKSSKPGAIILRIRESGDEVIFSVSDNGMGMSEENIEKLFKIPSESQSIGIYNINRRLINIYGKGLTIDSTIGLGTCVSFSVPKN